ncbi:baseplate J/gp47 family protein [Lachnospiraceae bacterium ZAX-1]
MIGKSSKQDIIELIRKKASVYTPEWKFDEENPDIGTTVAMVYADLFSHTLQRFQKIPFKNKIAFFDSLGASLLPALPGQGYVSFSLVNNEVSGIEVAAGTIVSASSDQEERTEIEYETVDDLYVMGGKVDCIYQTADSFDYVSRIYDTKEKPEGIRLFSLEYENLSEHVLYLSHEMLFDISHNAKIEVSFLENIRKPIEKALLLSLQDTSVAHFEYFSVEGFCPFAEQEMKEGALIFSKGEEQPKFAKASIDKLDDLNGLGDLTFGESFWIRCKILKIEAVKKIALGRMGLKTAGRGIMPDCVYGNGTECDLNEYMPFGETIAPYEEVYFGSLEVFGKRGAKVELSFGLNFAKIPLNDEQREATRWEWIMKYNDFKPNLDYDVTIDTVLWEYYNGSGWSRLFPDARYSRIFSAGEGVMGQYKTIEFISPTDIAPILVNACESYYIRARIVKVSNLFKITGNYIAPVLSDTVLHYQYNGPTGQGAIPESVIAQNNLMPIWQSGADAFNRGAFCPFYQTGYDNPALYLGFLNPPIGAPVKFLFTLQDSQEHEDSLLTWEYYNGRKWVAINLMDETKNLSRTGIVTIVGNKDFAKKKLFGQELYWIRIKDQNNDYGGSKENLSYPVLQGIYENTTRIINLDFKEQEYFTMEIYQENMKFTLLHGNIYKIQVYVDEKDFLSEQELAWLIEQKQVTIMRDRAGMIQNVWVEWKPIEDFIDSCDKDRHFMIDTVQGFVLFGNGKRGRIPPSGKTDNIRVNYCSGGGKHTNVKRGEISRLYRSIGFINAIRNPEPLMSGSDTENLEEALERNAGMIRNQKRAVTLRDFEELSMLASRDIYAVKCFSGYDAFGKATRGAVTLIILQKDFLEGQAHFPELKEKIYQYMQDKINGNLLASRKFFIREPEFVKISVRLEAVVGSFQDIFQVKKEIYQRLEDIFYPIDAADQNIWKIGAVPVNVQIENTISNVEKLKYLKKIFISTYINQRHGWKEVDTIPNQRYAFAIGGEHEVLITVE